MAFIKLQFKSGINRDQTNYSGEGGWWDGDKVRFNSGFPEKIGGWAKVTVETFYGTCRQMWAWITTFFDDFLALGTNNKLYIQSGTTFYDITPLRALNPTLSSPTTDNCIETTDTSTTVIANITSHDAITGSFVTIAGVTGTVGGVPDSEINANHQITVIDANSFSFEVTTAATSTVAAGGGTSITVSFEIEPGYAVRTAGYGWGTSTWGRSAWGSGSSSPVYLEQRDWFLDNFDNDFVANIRNGEVYYWERGSSSDPSAALATRAALLSSFATSNGYDANAVPVKVMQILLSQQDKHLLAFGAVPYGSTAATDFDPLLIRWASQDSPFEWAPTTTNSAGFLRVSRGSRIVRALPTRQEILVWSDTNLYALQFLGTTDVFGVQEYADNISIASPRACISSGNITYWMGKDKFYVYTGRVDTLPCTLRNYVFNDINLDQAAQIVCGTSEEWDEIWWFYPSAASNWNDRYVVFNYVEQSWYYGQLERTAWLDTPLRDNPQAATTGFDTETQTANATGNLYNHEYGVDADGEAMVAYVQSNDFDIGDGDKFMLCRRMIPDVNFNGSEYGEGDPDPQVTLQIRPRSFPGTTYQSDPADSQNVVETSVGVYTGQVFMRARARQMALKVTSDTLGVQWQLGSPRLDVREDGKR